MPFCAHIECTLRNTEKLLYVASRIHSLIRPFCVTSDSGGVCAVTICRIFYSALLVQFIAIEIGFYSSSLNEVLEIFSSDHRNSSHQTRPLHFIVS